MRILDLASRRTLAEFTNRQVTAIAFSGDGKYFAVGGYDFTVPVFNTADWKRAFTLILHDSTQSLAFSPGGLYIATGGVFHGVHIFDAKTGKELSALPHPAAVSSLAFSPDEHYLATGCWDKQARVFDLRSGKTIASISREEMVDSVSYSTVGRFVAVGELKRQVAIFFANGGEQAAKLDDEGAGVRFSPAGQTLATINSDGARIYSLAEPVPKVRIEHESHVHSFAVSRDQRCIATTAGETLRITDWQGRWVGQISIPNADFGEVALTADCSYIAAAAVISGADDSDVVVVYELQHGAQVATLPHKESILALAFHPDGKFLATGAAGTEGDERLRVFEIPYGKLVRDLPVKGASALAFSADGRYLSATNSVTPASDIQVLDFAAARTVWQSHQDFQAWSLALSSDGAYLAAGTGDATLRVFDVHNGRLTARIPGSPGAWSVAFSADAKYLAAGAADKKVSVYELSGGNKIAQADCSGEVKLVQFSPTGEHLVCVAVDATKDEICIAKRTLWRTEDLQEAVCRLATRHLYNWEWHEYLEGKPRKTCEQAP